MLGHYLFGAKFYLKETPDAEAEVINGNYSITPETLQTAVLIKACAFALGINAEQCTYTEEYTYPAEDGSGEAVENSILEYFFPVIDTEGAITAYEFHQAE